MNILALDTSAKTAGVAIGTEDSLLGECNLQSPLTHSQSLMPIIDCLCKQLSLTVHDIDCFAVSTGPGSFTGLRIGISVVKGFAYPQNRPCVGVSTLEALSRNLCGVTGLICTAMDARCNQVYTALFSSSCGKITRLLDDMAISIEELYLLLKKYDEPIFFVGDGASLAYSKLKDRLKNACLTPDIHRYQKASGVLAAARDSISHQKTVTADELVPTYLRLPQAERMLKKKKESGEEIKK